MPATSVNELESQLVGELITPDSDSYDERRTLWNAMFDKRPSFIVLCRSESDVVRSIEFARENDLLLAIRGGGHNSAGTGGCDKGLVIDLSEMNKVEVAPDRKTVKVEGGALLSDVDAETSKYGLAVSAGIISHTGVGGLTLGGGFGWISRKYGLTVDNLLSARIVTADGQVVVTSEEQYPELFWAIRGGGGNFGVVTEFTFHSAEIGKQVFSGVIAKSFDDAEEYLNFHSRYVRELPDEMTVWTVLRKAPPLPFIPEEYHGKLAVLVPFCFIGPQDEGEQWVQPIRDTGKTIGDGAAMHNWTDWQSAFDALQSHGARNYWKSHQLTEFSDKCIEAVLEYANKLPSDECEIFVAHQEGKVARIGRENPNYTAFTHRLAPFILNVHTRWRDEADDEKCMEWARGFYDATLPYSEGVYVNFLSETGKDKAKLAYSEESYDRLVQVKHKWDPHNLFRVNINIEP